MLLVLLKAQHTSFLLTTVTPTPSSTEPRSYMYIPLRQYTLLSLGYPTTYHSDFSKMYTSLVLVACCLACGWPLPNKHCWVRTHTHTTGSPQHTHTTGSHNTLTHLGAHNTHTHTIGSPQHTHTAGSPQHTHSYPQ